MLAAFLLAGCATPPRADLPLPPRVVPQVAAAPEVAQASFTQPVPLDVKPDAKAKAKPGAQPPEPPNRLPAITGAPQSVGGPLSIEEVLLAVEQHYPLLRAAEQERALAGGRLLTSLGAFDLNLTAGVDGQGTTYDNIRSGFGVTQGLPVAGLSAFAGYRNGVGDFPTYNLGQKTADGGEFRAGFSVPLLRGREIDQVRATVRQSEIDVQIAEPVIERQRIDFQRAAGRTFWGWVGAGQRLKYAEQLVELAATRDEQLRVRVFIGFDANFQRIDNQQNIALRNGVLVKAQRDFQAATIDLSLFLRDAQGRPTLAGRDRLPKFPEVEPVDPAAFPSALALAFESRPEPRRLRLQLERAEVDLRLALNQTLPSVNAVVAASQDVGLGKSSLSGPNGLDRTNLSAGLAFALPVQRRAARGKAVQAQAKLTQLAAQLQQTEDKIRADVQDAFSALERAAEFYRQARQRVELAEIVAEGERENLLLGKSSVLTVTLREQAAFDAEVTAVSARQDYFRAMIDFRAALGVGGR